RWRAADVPHWQRVGRPRAFPAPLALSAHGLIARSALGHPGTRRSRWSRWLLPGQTAFQTPAASQHVQPPQWFDGALGHALLLRWPFAAGSRRPVRARSSALLLVHPERGRNPQLSHMLQPRGLSLQLLLLARSPVVLLVSEPEVPATRPRLGMCRMLFESPRGPDW